MKVKQVTILKPLIRNLYLLVLLMIVFIGSILRIVNLSNFKIYPDSYQNLVVAVNLTKYHSVVGHLGDKGLLYPYFVGWTRPVYPLLITLFSHLNHDPVRTAQAIGYMSGIIGILAAYFLVLNFFKSKIIALIGASLVAISFNHVVWGGFILTETGGVLIFLLFLTSFFIGLRKAGAYFNFPDLMTGFLLTLAVFTRYEYSLLAVPVIYLIFSCSPSPLTKLTTIFFSLLFFSAVMLFLYFPYSSMITLLAGQLIKHFILLAIGIIGCLGVILLIKSLPKEKKDRLNNVISTVLRYCIWSIFILLFAQIVSGNNIPVLRTELIAIRDFFTTDFLLGIGAVSGLTYMLNRKKYRPHAFFVIITIILFESVYYRVNSEMQRYWTHLIPVLLLPASIGIITLYKHIISQKSVISRLFCLFVLIGFVWVQVFLTSTGIRDWNGGTWFGRNYEEEVAKFLKQRIKKSDNAILLTSHPEPYYLLLQQTTYSLSDSYPYIYLPQEFSERQVLIIKDLGMIDQFPSFSSFLDNSLQPYLVDQFYVHTDYHSGPQTQTETTPVAIYELPLSKLNQLLNNY